MSSGEALQGRIQDCERGANSCRRQRIEARSADQSAQSAEIFFRLQLSGWALVALSCFPLQVPDARVATRVPGSMLHRDVETKLFK